MSPSLLFRAVLCLSTALMMAISWPLWVTGGDFPRVPWVGGLRLLPAWASWVRFAVAIVAMVLAAWDGRWTTWMERRRERQDSTDPVPTHRDRLSRRALGLSLVLSAWMVLEDQFRLQPWMYQFLLMGFAMTACTEARAHALNRWFLIAVYLHSGLSKLDHTFVESTGQVFLIHLAKPFGVDPWNWPGEVKRGLALAMPCWEIGVATALATKARRIGVAGAVLLHVGLIAILGPGGMDHSANVLIWNAALILEVILLFGFATRSSAATTPTGSPSGLTRVASVLVIAACLLPFGERAGWWDTWPSFGLYASSNETTFIGVTGPDGEDLPPYQRDVGLNGIHVFEVLVSAWSLSERRVPLYPSNRALNGVAEALASRYRGRRDVRVTHLGRADLRTGARGWIELSGLDAIRRHGDRFWINAHPAH